MICRDCKSVLPDLLLEPTAPSNRAALAHVDTCADCRAELASLQRTLSMLDEWKAPDPSPYFSQRLAARLRDEQNAAPAGWLERLRTYILLNTGRQFRPALAMAMLIVLLIGGGTIADLRLQHANREASATVTDLQIFDKNDQALQTMDQLFQDESAPDDSTLQPLT